MYDHEKAMKDARDEGITLTPLGEQGWRWEAGVAPSATPAWYEVEGCGVDRFVCVPTYEDAARAVVEAHAGGPFFGVTWLDAGTSGREVARYAWSASCGSGHAVVSTVAPEIGAVLDVADLIAGEVYEAAPLRRMAEAGA